MIFVELSVLIVGSFWIMVWCFVILFVFKDNMIVMIDCNVFGIVVMVMVMVNIIVFMIFVVIFFVFFLR